MLQCCTLLAAQNILPYVAIDHNKESGILPKSLGIWLKAANPKNRIVPTGEKPFGQ